MAQESITQPDVAPSDFTFHGAAFGSVDRLCPGMRGAVEAERGQKERRMADHKKGG